MFTVVWTHRALDKFADMYVGLDLAAQDRLAAQIDGLNNRLARDPAEEGESRTAGYRVTFVADLTIRFMVDPDAMVARVYDIRRRGH